MLFVIAAVAENGVIGRNGTMPWSLPADLKHFKKITLGHPVIMGRRTFKSIGRLLPGRRNIVVTSHPAEEFPLGLEVVLNMSEALKISGALNKESEVFAIGGERIFQECLPYADKIYLTRIKANIVGDTFFPDYRKEDFTETESYFYDKDVDNCYSLTFQTLTRINLYAN